MIEPASPAASVAVDLTGNDYLSIPFIRADGALDGLNVLHGGMAALLEWTGDDAVPLFTPEISMDGRPVPLLEARWRRLDRWIPTATFTAEDVAVTLTICAPAGQPAGRGAFVRFELENRGRAPRRVTVTLRAHWRWSRRWIGTACPIPGSNRIARLPAALSLEMESGAGPALVVLAGGAAETFVGDDGAEGARADDVQAPNGDVLTGRITQHADAAPNRAVAVTYFVGAGRERDGALISAQLMARAGADAMLRHARLELSHIVRAGEDHRWAEMLNRNLLFNRFYAVGRAIDDDRLYLLRSRSTRCPAPGLFNEREALFWTLPALVLADPGLAREALFRVLDVFSERSGEYLRYLDGGALDPSFSLDQLLWYAWALDHYAAAADAVSVFDEPLARQLVLETHHAAFVRLHPAHLLAATDVLPSGDAADHPYTTTGNVLLHAFSQSIARLWQSAGNGEEERPPRFNGAATEIAAAIWQHCTVDAGGDTVLASSANLEGDAAVYDDPAGSLLLLPFLGFCDDTDPVWQATAEYLRSTRYPLWRAGAVPGLASRSAPARARTAALCADLLGPSRQDALDRLLRLRMDNGVAAGDYDPATGSCGEPHDAALAGHLAWALLHAAGAARHTRSARGRRR